MSEKIAVSGNSEILRWLVDTSLEETPWLAIANDHLKIDWSLALAKWRHSESGKSFDLPKSLEVEFENLLPSIPLSCLHGDQHNSVGGSIEEDPFPVPEKAQDVLASIHKSLSEIISVIDSALAQGSRSARSKKNLNEIRSNIVELSSNTSSICFVQRILQFEFKIGLRFTVAKGNMTEFLQGSSESRSYYSCRRENLSHRVESWRLARRLIKAQADLYFRLESMIKTGRIGEHSSIPQAGLDNSLKNLAALEKSLNQVLISTPQTSRNRTALASTFVNVQQQFFILRDPNQKPTQPRNTHRQSSYSINSSDNEPTPLGEIRKFYEKRINYYLKYLDHDLNQKRLKKVLNDAEKSLADSLQDLASIDRKIGMALPKTVNSKFVESTVDWLISTSPLLTMFSSGFLTVFNEDSDMKRSKPYVCLSPWLASSIMSKNLFGCLPLTYLGIDTGGDTGGNDEGDGDKPVASEKEDIPVNGLAIWELVQNSFA